jgi:hypothetical protein
MAIKHDAKVDFSIKLEYGLQKDDMCAIQLVATIVLPFFVYHNKLKNIMREYVKYANM